MDLPTELLELPTELMSLPPTELMSLPRALPDLDELATGSKRTSSLSASEYEGKNGKKRKTAKAGGVSLPKTRSTLSDKDATVSVFLINCHK